MDTIKRKVISPRVQCWGVKVRCRKDEFHSFRLADVPPDEVNEQELINIARGVLSRQMKSVRKAKLSLQPTDIVDYGDGLEARSFMVFSDKTLDIPLDQAVQI